MFEEQLKDAKNFKFQMGVCAILCFLATLLFIFFLDTKEKDNDWSIIPVGGIIFTVIYFNMRNVIKKYENLNKN